VGGRPASGLVKGRGAYCLDGVWLSEAEVQEHGLGHALRLEAPGGLAYVCTRA